MAVSIDQTPLYTTLPIGQQVLFAVSEPTIVANKFKVKFIAEVHINNQNINLSNPGAKRGIFKTTPNDKGVGIFDFRPILETFVKSDNEGSTYYNGSRYKTSKVTHPMHLIDRFAVSENAIRFFAIQFTIEFSDTDDGAIIAPGDTGNTNNAANTVQYIFFNGVLQDDNALTLGEISTPNPYYITPGNNYGYDLALFYPDGYPTNFLSNAPTTQYARLTDYGTLPFLNWLPRETYKVVSVTLTYYWDGGSSTETVTQGWTAGGVTNFGKWSAQYLIYFGAFPANLQNWSTTFATAVTNGLTHYTVRYSNAYGYISELYTVNIICPNLKGYEAIRLTWLNQWGTWDYYTFNMKSTRSIKTKRIPYTQQGGTWNKSTFQIKGWKGGKKNFRVNSTEKIKLNTDFVTEAEGVWFEELINSPEVYIVNGYDETEVAPFDTITNKYIEPVVLTTSSYVKKTIANDKLMQYTFEIEKSKMQRTQAV
mgnify:CR=1 FL=1